MKKSERKLKQSIMMLGMIFCICGLLPESGRCMDGNVPETLEPIDLLELSLSNLAAVTSETSGTERRINERKMSQDQRISEQAAPVVIAPSAMSMETTRPKHMTLAGRDIGPFTDAPFFATDQPQWLSPESAVKAAAKIERIPAENRDQVWESRIAAPSDAGFEQIKLQLQKMIFQVRSIDLEEKRRQTSDPVAQESAVDPTANIDVSEPTALQQAQASQPNLPFNPVSEQTLKLLEDICNNIQTAGSGNYLEVAEVLFRSGHLEQAAAFYRLAYGMANFPSEDKAWMLLQIGNCLKTSKPDEAIKAYSQLVAEYSGSAWKEIAKSQLELLNWYASDKPQEWAAPNVQHASDNTEVTER